MKKILLISGLLLGSFFPASAQIFQEDFTTNATLAGWTLHNVDGRTPNGNYATIFGTSAWKVVTWNSEPGNAVVSTTSWFNPAGVADRWLVTPQITLPVIAAGNTVQLTFDAKSGDTDPLYQDGYTVYISTTGTAIANFTNTVVLTVPSEANTWQPKTVDLTQFASTTETRNIYIAWRNNNNDKNLLSLDNIKVAIPSSCGMPTAIVSSDVTPTSATVSWTAPVTAPALGYEFYTNTTNVAPVPGTLPTGSVGAGVLTTPITLTEGVENYVWVRGKCSASSVGDWSAKLTINAPFSPTNVPYSYGFETNQGWTLFNAGTGNNWTLVTPTAPTAPILTAAEGASYLGYVFNEFNAANAWVFSRRINMDANVAYTVKFKYRVATATTPFPENLKVTIGNDATVAAQTTELFNEAGLTAQSWTLVERTFTPTTSGTYVLGFNCYSDADKYVLGIDDVVITSSLSNEGFTVDSFSVYPNPTADVVNISNSLNAVVNSIEIADLNGRVVKTQNINNTEAKISLSGLSAGVYMLSITTDKGSVTKKIVKQ